MVHTYGGQKNNTINLIVRQYAYFMVIFWYFFTHDELDRNMQPQHNITTMVVELFAPPAVWIQWVHATRGVDGLAHILSKAAVEGIFVDSIN